MYEPTKHQIEDSDAMLVYQHALLWADAGTGKTVTAMEALRKGGHDKLLVLCPRTALTMWKEELTAHFGKKYYALILRTGRPPKRKWGASLHADAIITTFDLADRHKHLIQLFCCGGLKHAAAGGDRPTSVIILDEAHMCKTPTTKRSTAILGRGCLGRVSLVSMFSEVWMLTGTPIMRHSDDLWTQLVATRREILIHYEVEQYNQFVDKFCTTEIRRYGKGPMHKVITGSKNHELLRKLLEDCAVIRRKLVDVVDDLPSITHRAVDVDYKKVENPNVNTATLTKELSDPNSPMSSIRRKLGIAKAPAVVEYATEHGTLPLLIGFWHKDMCAELLDQLKTRKPNWVIEVVDGSTSGRERDRIKDAFNKGEVQCLLGQMQAMNTSWNLQEACSHVLIAEELLSPGMLHQFYSRVYRRGQKNHVQIDHMRSTHSIDIALHDIRRSKKTSAEQVLDHEKTA